MSLCKGITFTTLHDYMHLECFNMFEDSHSREHVWRPAFFSLLYGSEASESFPRPTFTMNIVKHLMCLRSQKKQLTRLTILNTCLDWLWSVGSLTKLKLDCSSVRATWAPPDADISKKKTWCGVLLEVIVVTICFFVFLLDILVNHLRCAVG